MAGITAAGLAAQGFGGLINEDVMQQIWDISKIPLPLQDLIGSGSHHNPYAEWTQDALAAPDTANAHVDGADVTGDNTKMGPRVGNHTQQSVKRVQVSERAQGSDVIGQSNALAYQVTNRQQELRRDVDAIMAGQQASQADNGTLPGLSAGLGAWITTHTDAGATGTNGGFSTSTGIVAAPGPGTKRAISEAKLRDLCQATYQDGGNPSVLMGRPALIRKVSEYLFSTTAKVATMFTDVGQERSASVAKGAVNVFVTDFGITLSLVPNRLMQTTAAATSSLYGIDPQYVMKSDMKGIRTEPLAKTGTADIRMMVEDWTLKVLGEKAHFAYRDLDEAAAMTA